MTIDFKQRARKLRRKSAYTERVAWTFLRNRQLKKYKFRRQHVIKPYIVDYICLVKKLIIELDGEHHENQKAYDTIRTKYLERKGYKVLRFWNHEFLNKGDEVLGIILKVLEV